MRLGREEPAVSVNLLLAEGDLMVNEGNTADVLFA